MLRMVLNLKLMRSSEFNALPASGAGPTAEAVRADAARLVLKAVRERADAHAFARRRAAAAVAQLPAGAERHQLTRVLECHGVAEVVEALVIWCGQLEAAGRIGEAAEALDVALAYGPDDPTLILHAARVARKEDDRARARVLYDLVAELDDGDGRLSRLASVGRALVSEAPERELGRALRRARLADDHEAAAVALDARAAARRRKGDVGGAVRDYLVAAARYADPLDIGRIGHELADLLTSDGDIMAARHVLVETARRARTRQALWARSRLLVMSRALGDEVGMRRWADTPTPPLTSLSPSGRGAKGRVDSREGTVARWIRRVGSLA